MTAAPLHIVHPPHQQILCAEERPNPCGIVIFGASGDLAHRKIIPSLFQIYKDGLMPEKFFILGYARTAMDDDSFGDLIRKGLLVIQPQPDAGKIDDFIAHCHYQTGGYDNPHDHKKLADRLDILNEKFDAEGCLLFYLSTPPRIYADAVTQLGKAGLLTQSNGSNWRRVVLEKPFGTDLTSAREIEKGLRKVLSEDQIYRIDHYLGKETVQNIFMLRFANAIFEPLWNRHFIDHIQITAAEEQGIGRRAGYYDQTGCLRDMFQNHMMQLLSLVAKEPPASFEADYIRDERLKLLRSVRPFDHNRVRRDVVRAQYIDNADQAIKGYRQEPKIAGDSATETFVAARFWIDNWRWHGVPFYLRSGKRLARRTTEINIVFKRIPHSIFQPVPVEDLTQNILFLKIQPDEGAALTLQAKRPGPKLCMSGLTMAFKYSEVFNMRQREAYERLLLDTMLGDQTLFIRRDNIEMQWAILEPILNAWESYDQAGKSGSDLTYYKGGTWGPEAADNLILRDGREWVLF